MAIRIAIVGMGKIAQDQHIPVLLAHPGYEIAAIASPNASFGEAPVFATLDELLASDVRFDAVSMCQPPQLRYAAAMQAIRAGKHVFLEKPPGSSLSEVEALAAAARQQGVSLFASWHSRYAPAAEAARLWLQDRVIRSVEIEWKEDVRVWHPGQTWIWDAGGFGVFDPGINALSLASAILPRPLLVRSAVLAFPSNLAAPIEAQLHLQDTAGVPIRAEFDFLKTGPQLWDIRVDTQDGHLVLSKGGAELTLDGASFPLAPEAEYRGLYDRFSALLEGKESDVDLCPLRLVADAFLCGERRTAPPFIP